MKATRMNRLLAVLLSALMVAGVVPAMAIGGFAAPTTTWKEIPGSTSYVYTLDTDGVDTGARYLIVGGSGGQWYALNGASTQQLTGVTGTTAPATITLTTQAYDWNFVSTGSSSGYGSAITVSYNRSGNYTAYEDGSYYYKSGSSYYKITDISATAGILGTLLGSYDWTIRCEGSRTFTVDSSRNISVYKASNTMNIRKAGASQYLYNSGSNNTLSVGNTATAWTVTPASAGNYTINNGVRYLRFANGAFGLATTTTNTVRLYKQTSTETVGGGYVGMTADNYTFVVGRFADKTALDNYLKSQISVFTARTTSGTKTPVRDYTLTGSADPKTAGSYTYTVSYGDLTVGAFTVTFESKAVSSIALKNDNGSVYRGCVATAKTGSFLTVTYNDGTTGDVEITVDMLSGGYNTKVVGEYPGLTVRYEGKTVSGYTLNVLALPDPVYPMAGSVQVKKNGTGLNFSNTGVAKVELSASGIPAGGGVDVIVMLDTSSSMTNTSNLITMPDGSRKTRLAVLQLSLAEMITTFQTPGPDGTLPDVRIAIGDFNGYTSLPGTTYGSEDTFDGVNTNQANYGAIYTGPNPGRTSEKNNINASAFVAATNIEDPDALAAQLSVHSGTNYDYAFDTVYRLGTAIQAENTANGEERELYVIFMSDGSPYQYNYFYSRRASGLWNHVLEGDMSIASDGRSITVDGRTYSAGSRYSFTGYSDATTTATSTRTETVPSGINHAYFYNGEGNTHRMVEAIKGDPSKTYSVIDPTERLGAAAGQKYMRNVNGLGATMYTIGFCLNRDQNTFKETVEDLVRKLASEDNTGEKLYYDASEQEGLTEAFTQITNEIAEAATNARFVDYMGPEFDLKASTLPTGEASTITVSTYSLYQAAQVGSIVDGSVVTLDMVGTRRTGTEKVLETVTFNAAGSSAASDKLAGERISGDLLTAKTFFYNMSKTRTLAIDTDGDGRTDYNLAPETFYWNIGTIHSQEVVLSYYVFLTGTDDGTREGGQYETNEAALLYYTDWQGEAAVKATVSPVFSWDSASVSYGFYLVNEQGQPIDAFGNPTGFATRQTVGDITLYKEVLLNSTETIEISALDVTPDCYQLYDEGAVYTIHPDSAQTGSWWQITNTEETDSTYVTRFKGDAFSNEEKVAGGSMSGFVAHGDYVFTDTVAWFALVYTPKAVDDVVVIDFGLPVQISVLGNDMPSSNVTLMGLNKEAAKLTDKYGDSAMDESWNAKSLTFDHGTARIEGNKIVYTPTDMLMDKAVTFSYAMSYKVVNGLEAETLYLYANVTVVPATVMYYESSFATVDGSLIGDTAERYQAEDRPGPAKIAAIDADNLYGYDAAYKVKENYSCGSAYEIHGTGRDNVKATFTFTGTGFEIISRTSPDQGAIRVNVYDKDNVSVETVTVINNAELELYQLPVVSVNTTDLAYGTYTVEIGVYEAITTDYGVNFTDLFIFDAIRVFDPAGPDGFCSEVYAQDGEKDPTFVEIRGALVNQGALSDDGNVTGTAFVDKTLAGGHLVGAISDYCEFTEYGGVAGHGPNNEVYLVNGQAIAFSMDTTGCAGLHIGAKTIGYTSAEANAKLSVTLRYGGEVYTTRTVEISSATALFYDLFKGVDPLSARKVEVVIQNVGEGVLSVTDLKLTAAEGREIRSAAPVYMNAAAAAFAEAVVTALEGDANFDGTVSIQDASTLLVKLADGPALHRTKAYDTNHDGVLSVRDISTVLQTIAG